LPVATNLPLSRIPHYMHAMPCLRKLLIVEQMLLSSSSDV
jgi:hypothetical protein